MSAFGTALPRQRAFLARVLSALGVASLVFVTGIVLVAAGSLGSAGLLILVGLLLAGALAIAVLTWPTQMVLVSLILVPMSRFISMLVYSTTGSELALKASQLIKDEILIFLLIAAVNMAVQRRKMPHLLFLDLLICSYAAIGLLYMFTAGQDGSSPILVRLLALRQDVLWILAYFVGRGVTLRPRHLDLVFGVIVVLSVITALVALCQFVFPGLANRAFNALGFREFMAAIGTPHEINAVRSRGISGVDLARSSALFLSDLGLAFYQLLVVPLGAALYFTARRWAGQVGYGFFLILMLGVLAMTVTRSAILAGVIGLALVVLFLPSYLRAMAVAGGIAIAAVAGLLVADLDWNDAQALFSTKEGSAFAHQALIEEAVSIVRGAPLGLGLGQGSHVANLYGGTALISATESWYLQLALEMGLVSMFLFFAMLASATVISIINSFRVRDRRLKVLTVTVAAAGLSLIVIGIVQPVWSAVHVTYIFWLLAGISVRALTLEEEWRASGELSR
jgi:hypothetical protein